MRVRPPSHPPTAPAGSSRWGRLQGWLRGWLCGWTGQPTLVALLLAAHLAFCLARFPVGAGQKRFESVREWQSRGADGWCYRNADEATRQVARWLCEHVQPGQVLRFAGSSQGAMQLLAPLLFPALLVRNDSPNQWPTDRPVFQLAAPWLPMPAGATPIVKGTLESLRIEYR